jgi:16S rRNA (uracil1498-N3)-methyltransferase
MAPRIRVLLREGGLHGPHGAERALDELASHHLARVLRVASGQAIVLFDGEGLEREAAITKIQVERRNTAVYARLEGEPRPGLVRDGARVHVLQGAAKGDRLERVVRACAELGAAAVWPVQCERSVARPDLARALAQRAHLLEVSVSASEQCGRADLCEVAPLVGLSEALRLAVVRGLRGCFADERGGIPAPVWLRGQRAAGEAPDEGWSGCAVLVGPEGGLTDPERQLALEAGFVPVSLGPRVLRTETAGAAFVAIATALAGDLSDPRAPEGDGSPIDEDRAMKSPNS